ncbi:MAG: class I SAM-dependent methyltransferase [Promethearchaeota archaeon]
MSREREWYEDDEFWEWAEPIMFDEQRWAATPTETDQVLSFMKVRPGAAILDLGCGVGRHSLELARRSFRVTGVDRTAAYLEKARKQAKSEDLIVDFVEDDIRSFCRPDAFDGAISMFTTFGYFKNPSDDIQVLVNIFRSLKKGGVLVLETRGKEELARVFRERGWYERDGIIILEERKVKRNWSWLESRWIIIKGENRKDFLVSHRLYSASELLAALERSGFSMVRIYGDLSGSAYDHMAKRLVAVAEK